MLTSDLYFPVLSVSVLDGHSRALNNIRKKETLLRPVISTQPAGKAAVTAFLVQHGIWTWCSLPVPVDVNRFQL